VRKLCSLNELGYPKKVRKCQPLKKIPETDAIFEQIEQINQAADADKTMLRVSMDAFAPVLFGYQEGDIIELKSRLLIMIFVPMKR